MFVFSGFIVTSEFQTIIHSSYFTYDVLAISALNRIAISIFWNIYNTFSFICITTISRITVYKNLFTFSRCDRDICTITAIDTIFTILAFRTSHADRTIFTVKNYGRTIFTSCTNGTIFAIFTWNAWLSFFTNRNLISQCICVSMGLISSINILFYSQVFACCVVNSTTVFNSCCYCRSCSIIYYCTTICGCICTESITACNLVSQIGQIDNGFRASYGFTITIIEC